ncbi:adaptin N terminal region-domain-containing protein [Mycotypha africana]|uniref:adaptin N terminal region-domain-containing protein n=1 Tax=Mycotypha africana TaxID=64632 RepID=UPI0023008E0B|nr:adaptin N terminal region-domain-containing protein [Mycotypha africana]KAI8975200.1 adaptin N terminal region-domain-containing protein [Mycotypha africana]
MFRTNRFFTTNKKGEIYELKRELNSEYRQTRNDAVKKVIANMTVGKDVSGLFPDVLKNMQTEDIELKKLVYLYLMNYAKTQPELVILAVNTFVKDSDDPNPLIRALAIRTMGCIRVEKIIDYLTEPLRKCLKDENPYVRKTAAICVAKLFEIAPEMTEEQGFIDLLKDMVSDVNPSVVANAVTALMDIHEEATSKGFFRINENVSYKLMHALNECTEWGQIAILSAMVDYKPQDSKDAETICDKVIPRLQHANGAVVLAAVRVLLLNMDYLDDTNKELIPVFCRKMAPPLVTLLSSPPEFQYIALRNISLVLQKFPQVLSNEMRVFFCKYNDPLYVKLEKLEILMKLCNNRNVDQLLSELKEYANEVDVEFVRKAVNAIGRCAIKIEEAAERCINVLLDLINTGVSYVVQEAIIVIKDIFRKYPHTFEGIIPQLCSNLDILDEPQAKASLIWIVGEYAEKIDNADDLMTFFIENFKEENAQVQLQLLTATVKLFLKKPSENQGLVQTILQIATEGCDNADIRDRAYIYWRLLSTDPQAAKAVILSEKPPIRGESNELSPALLDNLISEIGTLASVYHKPADTFLAGKRYGADNVTKTVNRHHQLDEEDDEEGISAPTAKIKEAIKNNDIGDLLDLDWSEPSVQDSTSPVTTTSPAATKSPIAINNSALGDLLSLNIESPTLQPGNLNQSNLSPATGAATSTDDILKLFGASTTTPAVNNNNSNNNFSSIPGFTVQQQSLSPSTQNSNNTASNNNSTQQAKDPFAGLL